MPGQRCAVGACNSTFMESKKRGLKISFHKFPRNKGILKRWIFACRRKDAWNPSTSRVCSLHFKEQDFERNLKAELMKLPLKRTLKAEAVPSLHLGADVTASVAYPSSRDLRMQRRTNRRLVEELLETKDFEMESRNVPVPSRDDCEMHSKVKEPLHTDPGVSVVKLECEEHFFLNSNLENEMVPLSLDTVTEPRSGTVISRDDNEIRTETEKEVPWCKERISKIKLESEELRISDIHLRYEITSAPSESATESRNTTIISNYGCEFHTEIEIKQEPKLEPEGTSVLDCPAFGTDAETERREFLCPGITSHTTRSESYMLPDSCLEDDKKDISLSINERDQELLTERPRLHAETNCKFGSSISPFTFVGILEKKCSSNTEDSSDQEKIGVHTIGNKTEPLQSEENKLMDFELPQGLSNDSNNINKSKRGRKKSILPPSLKKVCSIINDDKRPYKCNLCGKRFTRVSHLKDHNLLHEGNRPYKCNVCSKSFTRVSHLKVHNLIHENIRPYKCNICEKSFTVASYLRAHALSHEGKKPHKCEKCDKCFTTSYDLKRHNLIHDGKKLHECSICGKSFTMPSGLKRHNLIHQDRKLHQCDICEKSFAQTYYLAMHKLIHNGDTPHKCSTCEKNFISSSALKAHSLIHEAVRVHKCRICEKSFIHGYHLKRHCLTHESKQSYKCEMCEKKFTHLVSLKRHKILHDGKSPHKCVICEKTFTHLAYLKTHTLIHQGKKPHECRVCGKSFTLSSNLKAHSLIHQGNMSHRCRVCGKGFVWMSHLKEHYLIHEGKRLHKCKICEKSFIRASHLKTHSLVHENRKTYKCEICGKSFAHLVSVKRHKLLHDEKSPFKCAICEKRFSQASHLRRHEVLHENKR